MPLVYEFVHTLVWWGTNERHTAIQLLKYDLMRCDGYGKKTTTTSRTILKVEWILKLLFPKIEIKG